MHKIWQRRRSPCSSGERESLSLLISQRSKIKKLKNLDVNISFDKSARITCHVILLGVERTQVDWVGLLEKLLPIDFLLFLKHTTVSFLWSPKRVANLLLWGYNQLSGTLFSTGLCVHFITIWHIHFQVRLILSSGSCSVTSGPWIGSVLSQFSALSWAGWGGWLDQQNHHCNQHSSYSLVWIEVSSLF